ncbi:MAG: hypothetical protein ACKV2Q_06060 [Planctomycetaceae bacterium]
MTAKTKAAASRQTRKSKTTTAKEYVISAEYLESVPPIFKEILAAFPKVDPRRLRGTGLGFQSIYSALDEKYTLTEIKLACKELELGNAVEQRISNFVHPTELGEILIAALTGVTAESLIIPEFTPPPRA